MSYGYFNVLLSPLLSHLYVYNSTDSPCFCDFLTRSIHLPTTCFLWHINLIKHHAMVLRYSSCKLILYKLQSFVVIDCPSFIICQAFVSEYAVTGKDAGTGSLLAALAEAAFLIGLEKNRLAVVVGTCAYHVYQRNWILYLSWEREISNSSRLKQFVNYHGLLLW